MGYEVDFLAVGEGERSGDAIAIRFGNLHGTRQEQAVIVIDGGFKESGEKLVDHIKKYYLTDTVDLVVSTHPDFDHSSGLEVVLEKLKVNHLWMHKPWEHATEINNAFVNGRVTSTGIRENLRKSLEDVRTLETIAKRKGIPITEPFAGTSAFNGALLVLGPTKDFYNGLLPAFNCLPESKEDRNIFSKVLSQAEDFIIKVAESWHIETLSDDGETSAENDSSTILLLQVDGKSLLFTGDAGQPALNNAVSLLEKVNFDFSSLGFLQVPHHGSHRNIGPSILNRLLGDRQPAEIELRSSCVSVSKDNNGKHPSKRVTNAFKRRGAPVHETRGQSKCHSYESPGRYGWYASAPLPLYSEFEE